MRIERFLAAGASIKGTARKFEIDYHALRRHWIDRVSPEARATYIAGARALLLARRGFGKTRTLAEWVCDQVASGQASRIALVAATAANARDVLGVRRYTSPRNAG